MRPLSLSASAANVYELCPARYAAEVLLRPPSIGGSAANLGTACHSVFERWIYRELYLEDYPTNEATEAALRALWDEAYWENFADKARYAEGWGLCLKWLHRQDWRGRTVLSTESKRNFVLHTSAGDIAFNYIMDRVDQLDDGDIEVVDYKSVSWAIQPEELKVRLQSRCYALAAHLEHPEARRIWVTFDLLRFEPVGIVFTAEECEETLRYLHALAERILADDGTTEQLNAECRWCMRKADCATLAAHVAAAGHPALVGSIEEVIERRAELDFAVKAIQSEITELDATVLRHLQGSDEDEVQAGPYVATLSSSRRRVVDSARLVTLVPPELFAKMATIGVTALDSWLKGGEVDGETASLVRRCIAWRNGAQSVSIRRIKGR